MGGRVLVVDDDAMVREALAVVLGERHEVVAVASARAALAALAGGPGFDAVLCDLQLGDGDAAEVCAAYIRAGGDERGFVVMTGGASCEALAGFVRRMPHVLGKPFDFEDTLALIDRVVR
jgi:CheY-like chemotaxis protein